MMLIGYMRPLDTDPQCEHQSKMLNELECEIILAEEHASAKRRIQLNQLLDNLQQGDHVVVTKLYVFADSTRHLDELLEIVSSKKAYFQSLTEGINTSKEEGYPFPAIVKHLLAFQSDVISEKTKQGMYEAKQQGLAAGRPRKPDDNVKRAIKMYESKKYTLAEIKEETGISKSTLYRYLEN